MKVLFANPPWWTKGQSGEIIGGIRAGSRWPFTRPSAYAPDNFRFGTYMPFPFFLAGAAAWVKREEPTFDVRVRDSIARGESYPTFLSFVNAWAPDAIVVEVGAASWDHDRRLLTMLKQANPSLRVAIAGPTARSASITGEFAAYLLGEYEKTATDFARGARGILGAALIPEAELATAPFPMFDEKAALHYWDACPKGQQAPHLQLFTSRGCPFRCCFCAWPATMTGNDTDGTGKRTVRFYSPEWIEAFICERIVTSKRPLASIYLDDDTFNLSDKHVLAVCEVMKRIGLPWSAMCRADTSSREAWMAMRDSGCFGVKLGFESGVQRVVDDIVGKKLDLAAGIETARWLRTIGMSVHGTFTVGLPGETPEERKATEDFIRKHWTETGGDALDTFQLSGTATIEGTPLDRIAHGESLAKFPGARAEGFNVDPDGNRKLETLKR
jgi:hypothetical protein